MKKPGAFSLAPSEPAPDGNAQNGKAAGDAGKADGGDEEEDFEWE